MKEFKTEYEQVYNDAVQLIGEKKTLKAIEEFKKVAYDNVIDHSSKALSAVMRLVVLSFNPDEDKYYGKS